MSGVICRQRFILPSLGGEEFPNGFLQVAFAIDQELAGDDDSLTLSESRSYFEPSLSGVESKFDVAGLETPLTE